MNKYVRNLLGMVFQIQPTQQAVHIDSQSSPRSPEEWQKLWQSQGQPWRTESEIDAKRQEELSKRRAIIPDIEKGIYPFKGMKLSRADVEWLLATHENGRGPVDWSDESQRSREGLDVRGADLCSVNLSNLPLARLRGGFSQGEWSKSEKDPLRYEVAVHMERALLRETHLEGAILGRALLERAILSGAHLEGTDCTAARLQHARLRNASLENANLEWARLENAHLQEANLGGANLASARVGRVYLDNVTLSNKCHIGPQVADIHWDGINLAVVKWSQISMLGDEYKARQKKRAGKVKDKAARLYEHETAIRANRQLAIALQNQGMSVVAALFAYRAQVLQRKVFWMQHSVGKWLFSFLLALLAGYGYRLWRIIVAYLLVVSLCAGAYFFIGIYHPPHLTLLQAFLESIIAFHGRVFYELFTPDTPQMWVTAFEAIAGLVIESVFIAMLTQRFFGK